MRGHLGAWCPQHRAVGQPGPPFVAVLAFSLVSSPGDKRLLCHGHGCAAVLPSPGASTCHGGFHLQGCRDGIPCLQRWGPAHGAATAPVLAPRVPGTTRLSRRLPGGDQAWPGLSPGRAMQRVSTLLQGPTWGQLCQQCPLGHSSDAGSQEQHPGDEPCHSHGEYPACPAGMGGFGERGPAVAAPGGLKVLAVGLLCPRQPTAQGGSQRLG